MMLERYLKFVLPALLAVSFFGVSFAINTVSDGWQLGPNTTTKVDATSVWGDCKNVVTPNDGRTRFVPTKTLAEWNSFKSAAAASWVWVSACPAACQYSDMQYFGCINDMNAACTANFWAGWVYSSTVSTSCVGDANSYCYACANGYGVGLEWVIRCKKWC